MRKVDRAIAISLGLLPFITAGRIVYPARYIASTAAPGNPAINPPLVPGMTGVPASGFSN